MICGAPGEDIRANAAIYIVSFQALAQPDCFAMVRAKHFKVAIVDEASLLKKKGTKWEEPLVNFFCQMKRILMLTGSRLTSNPVEIHNLVRIVRPDCIPDFLKFSNRFCDPVNLKEGVQF